MKRDVEMILSALLLSQIIAFFPPLRNDKDEENEKRCEWKATTKTNGMKEGEVRIGGKRKLMRGVNCMAKKQSLYLIKHFSALASIPHAQHVKFIKKIQLPISFRVSNHNKLAYM